MNLCYGRSEFVPATRKKQFFLVGVTLVAFAPFLNKAFHIDDPLFLWMAQQIVTHPLDPYGFSVNWAYSAEPMWRAMQNPPLCSYYMALVAFLFGWSEPALHLAFLVWTIISILGVFAVARRFCGEPLIAALLTLFTPVFVVSATNVMCDVMLLALWLWAIEFWLAGLDQDCWPYFAASGILISFASLTKYFGIALVPLLAGYSLARYWKNWPHLFFLLIPCVTVVAYECWTKAQYGQGLFSYAIFYSRVVLSTSTTPFVAQLLYGLSFIGGCLLAPLFFSLTNFRKLWAGFIFLLAALIAVWFWLPINPAWRLGDNLAAVRIEAGIFIAIAIGLTVLLMTDLLQSIGVLPVKDGIKRPWSDSWFLGLWIGGTFVFAVFFNWSITARTILPMAPAVAIVLVRQFENKRWPIIACAIVSLLVAVADYRQANSARIAADIFRQKFHNELGTIWFQSHWGFQYYMRQWGAQIFDARASDVATGDIIITPRNNNVAVTISPDVFFSTSEESIALFPFVSTMSMGTGASFYSEIRGPLPWAIARVAPEVYYMSSFR